MNFLTPRPDTWKVWNEFLLLHVPPPLLSNSLCFLSTKIGVNTAVITLLSQGYPGLVAIYSSLPRVEGVKKRKERLFLKTLISLPRHHQSLSIFTQSFLLAMSLEHSFWISDIREKCDIRE